MEGFDNMKKGVSATVISIILIMVGAAIILFLLIYFGKIGGQQIDTIVKRIGDIMGGISF